jgi:hypothetical protein
MSAKTGKELICIICGKSKYIPGKRLNSFKYCSYKCSGVSKKGIIPKMAFKPKDVRITGNNNYGWKGDSASYVAKHRWVKKWFGKPDHCDDCKSLDKKYNWANISGQYKRDRGDWKQLCISCHRKYDNWIEKMIKTRTKNYGY